MYGFAIIHAQYGPSEEKTEITAVRVGSNLNQVKWVQLRAYANVCKSLISCSEIEK